MGWLILSLVSAFFGGLGVVHYRRYQRLLRNFHNRLDNSRGHRV